MSINTIFAGLVEFKDNRIEDLEYLKYLAEHKYNVYKGGSELGVPTWTLLKHDWSKFLPSLWVPYREKFKGTKYYNPEDPNYNLDTKSVDRVNKLFRKAVMDHTMYEDHHDYKFHNPDGSIKPTGENLADWWALSKSLDPNTPDIKQWMINKKLRY